MNLPMHETPIEIKLRNYIYLGTAGASDVYFRHIKRNGYEYLTFIHHSGYDGTTSIDWSEIYQPINIKGVPKEYIDRANKQRFEHLNRGRTPKRSLKRNRRQKDN